MFDFCAIYASSNNELVSKAVHHIFKNQKNYHNDLNGTIDGIEKAFKRVSEELFGSENEPSPTDVIVDDEKLEDIINYLLDCSKNLEYFIMSFEESAIGLFNVDFHSK